MQESSTPPKEVSLCRRAHHCSKRSAHAEELSTTQRGQLMLESSAQTKEVSSALCKGSSYPGELIYDERGQLSSAQGVSSSRRAQL